VMDGQGYICDGRAGLYVMEGQGDMLWPGRTICDGQAGLYVMNRQGDMFWPGG